MPPKSRGDIEKLLDQCGLQSYDLLSIAKITNAFSLQDNMWITDNLGESYIDKFNDYLLGFEPIGAAPGGANIKRYLRLADTEIGIAKKRLSPTVNDVEMEVACYRLGKMLGVEVCESFLLWQGYVLSKLEYQFGEKYLIHVRHLLPENYNDVDLYECLIDTFPTQKEFINKMIIFDFITRQDDRHMSNLAVLDDGKFYPLYDNGRSLFYEDSEAMVNEALSDVCMYSTAFGSIGSYYDHLQKIDVKSLIDLSILTRDALDDVFEDLDIPKFRKEGAIEWILRAAESLK